MSRISAQMFTRSRFIESVETSGTQPGFQFRVVRPERDVEVQRQSDKRSVFRVNVPTQATRFNPCAYCDGAFFDEVNPSQQLVEAVKQFVITQRGSVGNPLLVLEQLDEKKSRAIENVFEVSQKTPPRCGIPSQKQGKKMLVSRTSLLALTWLPPRRSGARWPATSRT